MEILIQREEIFIPKWNDNKKEKTPVEVIIKHLNPAEYTSILVYTNGKVRQDNTMMVKLAVKDIANLSVKDDMGATVEIKTAELLLETPGLNDLYYEIAGHINEMVARVDPKN